NITLKNGFLNYYKIEKPLRNITFESVLDGSNMTITEAHFITGNNEISAQGKITHYLSEDRRLKLKTEGEINLNQIPNYYTLSPEIKELNGDANFTLSVKGPANDPASLDFSGNLTVKNVNIQGQSLAADVTGLNGTFTLSPDK